MTTVTQHFVYFAHKYTKCSSWEGLTHTCQQWVLKKGRFPTLGFKSKGEFLHWALKIRVISHTVFENKVDSHQPNLLYVDKGA